MIRFLDLQGQMYLDDTRTFAWFDTITDTFLEFNFSNYWETWDEFEDDYHQEKKSGSFNPKTWPIERFFRLFPRDWDLRYSGGEVE